MKVNFKRGPSWYRSAEAPGRRCPDALAYQQTAGTAQMQPAGPPAACPQACWLRRARPPLLLRQAGQAARSAAAPAEGSMCREGQVGCKDVCCDWAAGMECFCRRCRKKKKQEKRTGSAPPDMQAQRQHSSPIRQESRAEASLPRARGARWSAWGPRGTGTTQSAARPGRSVNN